MKRVRHFMTRAVGQRSANATGQDVVLAVDIGTTRSKGVIIDREANIIASASIHHPDTGDYLGHHEHDPELIWWRGFVTIVRTMLQTGRVSPSTIKCVCITGLFPCFCPTDHKGIPLHSALLYDDNQAVEYVRQIYRDQDSGIEGNELAGRIAWFRSEYPQLAPKLRRVFSCHNYVVFRLTGRYCVDGHTALLFGSVFDPVGFSWDKQELARVGVDIDLLPELLAPAELAGYVHSDAARDSGLRVGTPVIAGTGDIFASLLGSGAFQRGDIFAYFDTTTAIIELTQTAEFLFTSRTYKARDDGIIWHSALVRSGKRFEELLHFAQPVETVREPVDPFSVLEAGIDPSQVNWCNALYFPEIGIAGEYSTVNSSLAGFLALPLGMSAGDVYRTMVEGLGFMIRHSLNGSQLLDPRAQWYATGGGANSQVFCQLISDALSHANTVVSDSDTAIGGSIAAGCFAGFFTYEDISGRRAATARSFAPQDQLRGSYDRRYKEFAQAYAALQLDKQPSSDAYRVTGAGE